MILYKTDIIQANINVNDFGENYERICLWLRIGIDKIETIKNKLQQKEKVRAIVL